MGFSFMITISRRCLHHGNTFTQASLTRSQWRLHYTNTGSTHQVSKTRDLKIFYPIHTPSPSYSFSTSSHSQPKSKVGFVGWYLNKLDSHPITTKIITTSLIYAAADLTAQRISSPSSGSFELIRTFRMAGYGLLILGPSQHLWFNFISRVLPKRDLLTTAKKLFLGQAVYGPANITIFFSYNAALQGESSDEIVARLKRDLLPTMKSNLLYWPACDFVTFKFVPVHLQPLVNSVCSYVWTIYLTYMASLQKVSTD